MFSADLALAIPELILAASALLLLVWGAYAGGGRIFSWLAVAALVGAAVAAAFGPQGSAFSGGLVADNLAAFAKVFIYAGSAIAIPLGERWFARRGEARFEFSVLIILTALGMGMMASAGDLISLYVGVELHSLALYVLAAFRRDDARASEAGLKYFVLGALSSGLLLYGASLIYGFAGSTRFTDIAAVVQGQADTGVLFGLVFTGAPKLAAMVLFARALGDGFLGAAAQWQQVLVVIALLSVFVGAFAGLVQRNLKRLWAYSSIANVGYALIGLSAGTPEGLQAMLLFMVLYMVDVTGFFACLVALNRDGKAMETMDDMAGLIREKPALGLAMTVFAFSALGLPPLSGFWAKFYVFKAAINADLAWVAVAGLVGSVVAAFYYLRLVKVIWFDDATGRVDKPAPEAWLVAVVMALFSFPVVMVALTWLDPLARAAASIFG